ncbi:MAG: cytochrome c3 family protein [Candidatus Krumholzibacteriia bacterium]
MKSARRFPSPTLALAPVLALAALMMAGLPASGADFPDAACRECHTRTGGHPPEIGMAMLAGSVHESLSCTDCHGDIQQLPHAPQLGEAACGSCHSDAAEVYVQHGRAKVAESPHVPTCAGCHGSHDILPASSPQSRIHPSNQVETCGRCHEDQALLDLVGIRFRHPVEIYRGGVHGKATAGGTDAAASCNDCHSTGGSAHRILSPGSPESTINFFNIPKTCGKCHGVIEQDYWEGIHGQMVARGQVDSPTCTHCHGEHNILRHDDPRSPVSAFRVAEATCTPCHESAALNEKYDLPTGRLQSFVDSYHGLKSRAGDRTVANCASCHHAHLVLPASDPRSSVNPDNLPTMCGECHPGISPAMATTPIHATATGHRAGWPWIVRNIYLVLIVVVIGGMIVHWLIDLFRQIINVTREPQVHRMEPDEVVQHAVLALSFTLLVVTGFSLRFYDAFWSRWLFGWDGGASARGALHRGSGIVMMLGAVWHLLFLATPRGRRFLRDMLPRVEDVKQLGQMMKFNLGRSAEHPHFGRFSYVEKAEYWALVWGTVIMGLTGIALWFENAVVVIFPKGLLDVMLVIHYYEAWLAFLAILIWHMYATVFSPKVYPMNPSWLTGTMPYRMFVEEHPAAVVEPVGSAGAGTGRATERGQADHPDTERTAQRR